MAGVTLEIEPLDATFGARVSGLRLTALDDESFVALYAAWLEHALLIFSEQFLSHDAQVALARRFGKLEFDIAPLSNVRSDGTVRVDDDSDEVIKLLKGNMGWHHDSTYMPLQAKGAVFSAEVVPSSGGETGFADMRAAYEALDDSRRALVDTLRAHHSLYYSQSRLGHEAQRGTHGKHVRQDGTYVGYGFHDGPVSVRPLVKAHPETGRRSLVIGRHAYDIVGMSAAQSEALLDELAAFACQPPRVYYHQWQPGDVVIWDNRCLMHRATPWPMHEARVMWHSRIAGDPITEAALTA